MASSVKHVCTSCKDNGMSKRAVKWCTECEVLFCGDCAKYHSKSRLSKNHKTMSSEDYHKLPTIIQEISSQCKDHKKNFELYCSFHACPCCVQCVTDTHMTCKEMKPLSEIVKNVKASASVKLFEKDLKNVQENLDAAIQFLKTKISTINAQKTKAVEEIRYMRKSINDYLNKLEQDILNDLESKQSKLTLNMYTLVQQMEQRASRINELQSQFTKMTHYATELQMYIGLRQIERTTSQTAKYIDDLESKDHFIEKNLEVNISSALQSLLHDVKSFGDININTTSSTLQLKAGRKDQAQTLISEIPEIEQIKPSLLTKLTIPKDLNTLTISTCRILPDGKIIILENKENQLLLFSNDGIFTRKVVTFKQDAYDVCFVRNNTVAVALGSAQQTAMVDIEKNKKIKTITLSHYCYGVSSDDETLVISSGDRQSTRVNLNDMSHTIIEGIESMGYISLFQENIYGTILNGNKVCCSKTTGELLWTSQYQGIDYSAGIALDMNGFVYIASRGNNSVVVVSPDGKTCKTILSEADGIKRPYGIDINRERRMMIVSTKIFEDSIYDTAIVYEI
ncbi:Hypothetical predicted protein [Mytilus galloprovincialis]|uniref:B box-type domain-containing protein n=1 Tax=Mytilus galloprovincialis TaxID=29158 RepID=A0A8B6C300_MYTGA|nr:Hypothetical predicted protein [Mytilus galloprovincialis]